MTRVLHVHEHPADFQTTRSLQQLQRSLPPDFDIHTHAIGNGSPASSHSRHAILAPLDLRRRADSFDIAHAWGLPALSAAAFAPFKRLLFTPTVYPSRRHIRWLRAIMNYRGVNVVCSTTTLHKAFVQHGVPVDRCHLIRPGVDFARIKTRRDVALRAALGIQPHHRVLLGVGESTRAADHHQLTWTGTILNVLDRQTRVLLWGRGPLATSAARFSASLAQPELLILAEQTLGRPLDFEDLFPAADLVAVSATAPVPTLPIAIAMASAVPIIATVTPTVAELLEDRHTALMTQPNVPRLLAQRILQMRDDPQQQRTLADTARAEAYEFFPQSEFVNHHRTLYNQLTAQPDGVAPVAHTAHPPHAHLI